MAGQTEPTNPNDVPLGQKSTEARRPDATATLTTKPAAPAFMMASLSNKNKRRGFKQAMTSALPKKIIFSAEEDETSTHDADVEEFEEPSLPFSSAPAVDIRTAAPNLFPRLIPPSELQEQGKLPPNMFVTSIDVEEGMYPSREKTNKKKHKHDDNDAYLDEVQEMEQVELDYGAEDTITTQRDVESAISKIANNTARDVSEQDWSAVEAKWDSLPKVTNESQVQRGSLVGWKVCHTSSLYFTN